MTALFKFNQYKIVLYFIVSLLLHATVMYLITREDFEKNIEYEELSIDLPVNIPFVVAPPEQEKVSIKRVEEVKVENKTVEIVDKKVEEEEEKQEEKMKVEQQAQEVAPSETEEATEEIEFQPFYSIDKRPSFLQKAVLVYPLKERRRGREGLVVVEVDIDSKGSIRDLRIVKSGGENFDEAAIAMIKSSTFSPGYKKSEPVAVRMRFNVRFTLNN